MTYYTNLRGNKVAQSIEPLNIGLEIRRLLHVSVQRLEMRERGERGEREGRERRERREKGEREKINKCLYHSHTYGARYVTHTSTLC